MYHEKKACFGREYRMVRRARRARALEERRKSSMAIA